MNPLLRSTLLKVALPLIGIVLPMLVAKLRGFDVREFFGLYKPKAKLFAMSIALWIVWMAVTEALLQNAAPPWPEYPPLIVALRILAIGILGPIAEELIFRGLLYGRLSPRLGPWITIVLIALIFGLIHTRYGAATIALIVVDGVLFGVARYKTNSVLTPMAMHSLGNLLSVFQSIR